MKARISQNDVIDTGLVEFVLPFDRGEEKIYFNPNDIDFFIRLTDMINSSSELYEEKAELFEKEEDEIEKLRIVDSLNEKIKKEVDVAFGNDVSSVLFKYCSPVSIVKSKNTLYLFYILDWILPKIQKETQETSNNAKAALDRAMAKHTQKYQSHNRYIKR
jgi:hypothetical protein